jgi:hypothetical protein
MWNLDCGKLELIVILFYVYVNFFICYFMYVLLFWFIIVGLMSAEIVLNII